MTEAGFLAGGRYRHASGMLLSPADTLIANLEDFTPPAFRERARVMLPALLHSWRRVGRIAAVRINDLGGEGILISL